MARQRSCPQGAWVGSRRCRLVSKKRERPGRCRLVSKKRERPGRCRLVSKKLFHPKFLNCGFQTWLDSGTMNAQQRKPDFKSRMRVAQLERTTERFNNALHQCEPKSQAT